MKARRLGSRKRFAVLSRDNFACRYCGRGAPAILHVDHIQPKSRGGGDGYDNLITACSDCNMGKSNKPLTVQPQDILDPWSFCPSCSTGAHGLTTSHTWDIANGVVVMCPLDEAGRQTSVPGFRKRVCYNRKHWQRKSLERHEGACQETWVA